MATLNGLSHSRKPCKQSAKGFEFSCLYNQPEIVWNPRERYELLLRWNRHNLQLAGGSVLRPCI